jgi:hypothetical protein
MKNLAVLAAIVLIGCYESSPYDPGGGAGPTGPWPDVCDGVWEQFDGASGADAVDLQGYAIVFVPVGGEVVRYRWSADDGVRDFPFRPGSGATSTVTTLGDDDYIEYRFHEMGALRFFGVQYESMFVGSNGYVTFGEGSGSLGNFPADHFALPGVAALRGDLDPRSMGRIVVDEWASRVVITFDDVPGFGESTPNDFQIVIHTSGVIEIHYPALTSPRPLLAGISNGLPGEFPPETDFVGGPSTDEHCGDARDNDGDGMIDCEDPDCADDVEFCGGGTEWYCWNGLDDDDDGLWDCEDPDCFDECEVDREWDCWDGRDNDGDGLWDCDDPDCREECVVDTEVDCWDGWDNDGDGLWDCDDPDCWEECTTDTEIDCWDGRDNDRDGFWDCADPDCYEACGGEREWDCWDGWDNDGDGLWDCEDPDCFEECEVDREWDCWDGWDNDRDGALDCDDPDCFEECEITRERDCGNGRDDDRDGSTDCDDIDCRDATECANECQGFWQTFEREESIDLANHAIRLVPDREDPNGYTWTVTDGVEDFPYDPEEGLMVTAIDLADDDYFEYFLETLPSLELFGERYDRFFVSSNGYISFVRGSRSTSPDPLEHFALPSIAALRGDLDPRMGGTVLITENREYVVVTYLDVPWERRDAPNSFQIVLHSSGVIELAYPELAAVHRRFLTGISNGCPGHAYPPPVDWVAGPGGEPFPRHQQ